jgi:hypothetical protein
MNVVPGRRAAWYFGLHIPVSGTQAAGGTVMFSSHPRLSQGVFFSADYKIAEETTFF